MKKIPILLIFMAVSMGVLSTSCQKSIDVGATSAVKVANDWWCQLTDTTGQVLVSYAPFATYNTSENDDSMWVDDNENLYGFKVKAKFNSDGTFETASSFNADYDPSNPTDFPETVTITDGKVLSNAAKSKTGVTVDSIYMKIKFSGDPDTYLIEGLAKTGWDADNY